MNRYRPLPARWFAAALIALMLLAQGAAVAHTVDHVDSGAETCLTCKAGNSLDAPVELVSDVAPYTLEDVTPPTFQRGQNSRQCPGGFRTRAPPSDAPVIRI